MKAAVESIRQPDLLFIRGQADAVAWTTVALRWSFAKSFHLDPMQHLAGFQISDFKAEQFIDVHKAKALTAVDRERSNYFAERADFPRHLMGFRVGNAQER